MCILVALTRASSIMLKKSNGEEHPYRVPDLSGNASSSLPIK